MRILMFTNTYAPLVGGVSNSVQRFVQAYRQAGHQVLVVAPRFGASPHREPGTIRVPAIQHFNGSDFALAVPIPGLLRHDIERFEPDVIHSHHPFLLGETALRFAETWKLPIVFTHHTLYEQYTHYVPGDSPRMKRFAIQLATGYARLCDAVIAPSQSIADLLLARGVDTPLEVIPTGVDFEYWRSGDPTAARRALGIDEQCFLVGHVGRLAPEKNLGFLANAVGGFLVAHPQAHFVVTGDGPARAEMQAILAARGVSERAHFTGPLAGQALIDLYHALDVFAFASHTETQGMVLTEAMAAGVPVVAVDAPGAREVVHDREDGRLIPRDDLAEFAAGLAWIAELSEAQREQVCASALETARSFCIERCAGRALELYQRLIAEASPPAARDTSGWNVVRRRLEAEWKLLVNVGRAARSALQGSSIAPDETGT